MQPEINLYDRDPANTYISDKIEPPIILIADIVRGGVFAKPLRNRDISLPILLTYKYS